VPCLMVIAVQIVSIACENAGLILFFKNLNLIFYLKLIFFYILNYFDVLISKIIFLKNILF
jgi:hypothetical protein